MHIYVSIYRTYFQIYVRCAHAMMMSVCTHNIIYATRAVFARLTPKMYTKNCVSSKRVALLRRRRRLLHFAEYRSAVLICLRLCCGAMGEPNAAYFRPASRASCSCSSCINMMRRRLAIFHSYIFLIFFLRDERRRRRLTFIYFGINRGARRVVPTI